MVRAAGGGKMNTMTTPSKTPPTYQTVFRVKAEGKGRPRIGTPASVQPGDVLVFSDDRGAFVTRVVTGVGPNGCLTEPIMEGDKPRNIRVDRYYEAIREVPKK